LIAMPMLAAAGSLVAGVTSGHGFAAVLSGLLAVVVVAIAGINLYGAVVLVQRGVPRYAQLGGYLTIGLTAVMLTGLLIGRSAATAVTVALFFLAPAIAVLTLLGTRRARRWIAVRGRDTDFGSGPRHALREFR
jgi:hypothetical protein